MRNIFKPKRWVSLAFREGQIYLLRAKKTKQGPIIKSQHCIPLSKTAIVQGHIQAPDLVVAALKELVKIAGVKGAPALLALPASCVLTRQIQLPMTLTDLEIEAEIHLQLPGLFPGMNAPLYFDFVKEAVTEKNLQTIKLVAAKQNLLDAYHSTLLAAGLKLKVVDIDAHALTRVINLVENEVEQAWILLDADESTLQFILIKAKKILFCQVLDGSVQALDLSLKNTLQMCYSSFNPLEIKQVFLTGKLENFSALTALKDANLNCVVINPLQSMLCKQESVNPTLWTLNIGLMCRSELQW